METPLVSVVVITFNSSEYILECLDSIKKQTYQNIELIISDDCSKDDTVQICKKWLLENKERFVRTELICVEKNTGTSANINRGIKASFGEWIKSIAGDDRLLSNCISDNVNHVINNKQDNILFSKVIPIGNIELGRKWPYLNPEPYFSTFTPRQFRILLCEKNFLPAASVFMRKSVWEELGGYNEDIPLIEDWPMWMKATQIGYDLSFMNKETVEYRFSDFSISHHLEKNKQVIKECWGKAFYIGRQYLYKDSIWVRFFYYTHSNMQNNIFYALLHYMNVFNPFYWEHKHLYDKFAKIENDFQK